MKKLAALLIFVAAICGVDRAYAAAELCAPFPTSGGAASNVVNPATGIIYTLDGRGCATFNDLDVPYFLTQGYTAPPSGGGSGSGTVTSITTTAPITGGHITTTGVIGLANTSVVPGSYTNSNITIDAQGRITLAANGTGGGGGGTGTVTSVGSGTGLTGGPITVTGALSLANTAVSPGSYTNPNITVDAQGRLTSASNGTAGGTGTVTSVNSGTGLTGGPITTSGMLSIANTAVTPGSYTNTNLTVDAQGRITAAGNGSGGAGGGTVTNVATGTGITGGPITTTGTLALANTSVVPGSYTNSNITVDAQGRIIGAANGTASGGPPCNTSVPLCYAKEVNVLAAGALCNGGSDDHDAIQAAIDYAIVNNIQSVVIPHTQVTNGPCTSSLPIYLDAPGNLRGGGIPYFAGSTYGQNDVVTSSGIMYASLTNSNIGNTPASSPTQWRVFAWEAGRTYAKYDLVTFGGVPWISLHDSNTGHSPAVWDYTVGNDWWVPSAVRNLPGLSTPTCLIGELGYIGRSQISFGYTYGPMLIIGTGNNQCVKNLNIRGGGSGLYRGQFDGPNGPPWIGVNFGPSVGIAISGDGVGAQNTLLENVTVANAGTCIGTSWNSDGLSADNTFRNVTVDNCGVGINISTTQNDINQIDHPIMSNVTTAVQALTSKDVLVIGGNLSNQGGLGKAFAVTGVTILGEGGTFCGATDCITFELTITTPDTFMGTATLPTIYTGFTVVTPSFKVIPLQLTAWNPSTKLASFTTTAAWTTHFPSLSDPYHNTSILAEIGAVTTLYAAERVYTFRGTSITALKTFTEQGNFGCWTYFDMTSVWDGGHNSAIREVKLSPDPGASIYGPAADADPNHNAIYYCQQQFPLFQVTDGGFYVLTIDGANIENYNEPVNIDITQPSDTQARIIFKNTEYIINPNIRIWGGTLHDPFNTIFGAGPSYDAAYMTYRVPMTGLQAVVDFDLSPWKARIARTEATVPATIARSVQNTFYTSREGRSKFTGMVPNPEIHPRLTNTWWNLTHPTLGPLGSYPILYGGVIYSTLDTYTSTTPTAGKLWATLGHFGGSYGQDLNATTMGTAPAWSYTGQSFALNIDAKSMGWIHPGLLITLDRAGTTTKYLVTGTHPQLGYIDVINAMQNTGAPYWLDGTAGTVYNCPGSCTTGTKIGQAPFVFTQY